MIYHQQRGEIRASSADGVLPAGNGQRQRSGANLHDSEQLDHIRAMRIDAQPESATSVEHAR